jgi:hypothetical protein
MNALVVLAVLTRLADVRSLAGTEDSQARTLRTQTSATVDQVDPDAGVVTLRVGTVPIRIPVENAHAFHPGDHLTVDVTLTARPANAAQTVPDPTPPERGVRDPGSTDHVDPTMRGPLRPGR